MTARRDLVVLVADKDMEHALKGILSQPGRVGMRPILRDILTHPEKDPGCLLRAHDFLRTFVNRYHHALVLFDFEGCGKENIDRQALEESLERRLAENGWEDRAAAIVIAPELEVWVWGESPKVREVLGWKDENLRGWLEQEGYTFSPLGKPDRPKEAMEAAIRQKRQPRSSAMFEKIASNVSLNKCVDPAFQRLCGLLREWFPENPGDAP